MTNVERNYIRDLREDLDKCIGALLEEKSALKGGFFPLCYLNL